MKNWHSALISFIYSCFIDLQHYVYLWAHSSNPVKSAGLFPEACL